MKLCKTTIVLLVVTILAGICLSATPSQSVVYDYRQGKQTYHAIDTCSSTDIQVYTPISWTTVWDLGLKPCSVCEPQSPSDLNLLADFITQPSDKYFHKVDCTTLNSTSLKITMDLKTLLSTGRVPCRTCKPELPLTSTVIVVPTDPNELIGPAGPQGEKGDIGPVGPMGLAGEKGEDGIDTETPCTIFNYATGERWKSPLRFYNTTGKLEWNIGYKNNGLWYASIPSGIKGEWVFQEGAWVRSEFVFNRVVAIFYGNSIEELAALVAGNLQDTIDSYIGAEILAGRLKRIIPIYTYDNDTERVE